MAARPYTLSWPWATKMATSCFSSVLQRLDYLQLTVLPSRSPGPRQCAHGRASTVLDEQCWMNSTRMSLKGLSASRTDHLLALAVLSFSTN